MGPVAGKDRRAISGSSIRISETWKLHQGHRCRRCDAYGSFHNRPGMGQRINPEAQRAAQAVLRSGAAGRIASAMSKANVLLKVVWSSRSLGVSVIWLLWLSFLP